jgi:Zn-dependent M28 family amino/carboxypeptidase
MNLRARSVFRLSPIALFCLSLSAGVPEGELVRLRQELGMRTQAYDDLKELCSVAPARLAGSAAFDRGLDWARAKLSAVPGARVWLQEVQVPGWRRGRPATAHLTEGADREPLALLALGFSSATPESGIEAEVLEVSSLAELEKLGAARVAGKIVFFNRAMELDAQGKGSGYGGAVDQRSRGPAVAARLGAAAAVLRSVTNAEDDQPHTGMTRFAEGQAPLPCAALGVRSAQRLALALRARPAARLHLFIEAFNGPPVRSANLVAEIKGREVPEKILLVGGHLDSWDASPSAHDNGTGVVQSIEVFRLLARAPGPRHTLRCVLFTTEEMGSYGGREYGRLAAEKQERHVLAVETDGGGFAPSGFDFGKVPDEGLAARLSAKWGAWLKPFGIAELSAGGGGTDVRPLQQQGSATASLHTDAVRYFKVHHAPGDTVDRVDARELEAGAGAIATLLLLADREGL